ncbi:MAG: hypothetical protein J7K62_03275 [Thermoplasmata archaeon]|nr:hypothetical protein [Thermoplasmata archaeon]
MLFKSKKKKVPQYSLKLTPDLVKKLPEVARKQISELIARNNDLEEEIKKLKKEIDKYKGKIEPEEVKIVKEALNKKNEIEKKKESRRIKFILEKPVKILAYDKKPFKGKKGTYKYLHAIELQEYDVGYAVNLILKKDAKSKEIGRISTDLSLDELFNKPYIVSELKSNTFIAPIYSDGKVVSKIDKSEVSDSNTVDTREEYYIKELSNKDEQIKRLMSELYQVKKVKNLLEEEVNHLRNELDLANERADMSKAISLSQMNQIKDIMREYSLVLSSLQESEVNKHLSHKLSLMLSDALERLRTDISEKFGISVDELEFEKYFGIFKAMLNEVKDVSTPKITSIEKRPEVSKK